MDAASNELLNERLKPLRNAIDAIDDQILELLAQRFSLVKNVARTKGQLRAPVLAETRIRSILERLSAAAVAKGLDASVITLVYDGIHVAACQVEADVIRRMEAENHERVAS